MRTITTASFEAIARKPSLSQEVLSRLVEMLLSGELTPGQRLPPERGLAEMMGVSRPSLREGLRALTAFGVLESKQGHGTFLVRSLNRLPLEPYLLQLLLNTGKLHEFIELRQIIEPSVAALAARRAGEDGRAEITRRWRDYEKAVESGDREAENETGRQFHLSLARATGNQTIVQLMDSLNDLMRETGRVVLSQTAGASRKDHRSLYQAVMKRQPAEARRLMKHHLDEIDGRILASFDKEVSGDGAAG
jgi:GntR family transcriptional repressor for pyruvate dehydrogenase complex